MPGQVFRLKTTICARCLHLQVDAHNVFCKVSSASEKLLAFSTLVLPLSIPMPLSYVLLQVFHHFQTLRALAPLVKMNRADMLLQCITCGAPGVALVAGKVSHFEVNILAVAVQVLNLFSTVWACLFHAQVHSLKVISQVGLILECLVTLRTFGVPLLLVNNSDMAGKAVHTNHLFALRASQFGLVVNTFHVLPQVEAACELGLAVLLGTGERQILLMDKSLVLFHVCHRDTTLEASLCPLLNGSVGPLVLFQRKRREELLVTEVTLQGFLLLVLDPVMSLHVKRLLSTELTLGTHFVLVLQLYMPAQVRKKSAILHEHMIPR